MSWFGPRDCNCNCEVIDCGCWNDIGDKPVLMIELNVTEDAEDYRTCAVLEGGVFVSYCRVAEATYGVGLQGSIPVPLKRVCNGGDSILEFDIEETYRPIDGLAEYWWRDTGGFTCSTLRYMDDDPYWIEVRKETNTVVMRAFGASWQVYPATWCQRNHFSWLLGNPQLRTPKNPVQPGECGDPVSSIEWLGSYSWEIVPGV